jgi:hypothetical protein
MAEEQWEHCQVTSNHEQQVSITYFRQTVIAREIAPVLEKEVSLARFLVTRESTSKRLAIAPPAQVLAQLDHAAEGLSWAGGSGRG